MGKNWFTRFLKLFIVLIDFDLKEFMAKKKSREDLAFPITTIPHTSNPLKPAENPMVIRQIILGAVKGAYQRKTPSEPGHYSSDYGKKQKPIVSQEEIEFVTHLVETLEPTNAIEAALASQFVITYIRGLNLTSDSYGSIEKAVSLFQFGHEVLETLTRYRTKGAQLISVNYNHNQAQVNNYNLTKKSHSDEPIEVADVKL